MITVQNKNYKVPEDSETVMTEVVCPNDTNPMGMLQGGRLVQWMDIAAAVCAQEHAEQICVTSNIYGLNFKIAAQVGDIITIKAKITRAFNSSMEINVKAWRKKVFEKDRVLINEAYFTFVAIGENARPVSVPGIIPASVEEEKEYRKAETRKKQNLAYEHENYTG